MGTGTTASAEGDSSSGPRKQLSAQASMELGEPEVAGLATLARSSGSWMRKPDSN
jgi:hypothetical protein